MYLISNFLGKLIIKKESKYYNLRSVFGFAFLASILELIYLPFMLSGTSSAFPYITLLVLGFLFIMSIFKTKREDFFFLKSPVFYILIILGLFIYKIYYPMDAGDDSFYLPFIRDLASNKLFSINPRTGFPGMVQTYYVYQGYYFLMSSLNYFFTSPSTIFFVFKFYMSALFITFLSQIIDYVKGDYKMKGYAYWLIFTIAIFLLGYPSLTHIYWGSFALYPVFIPLYTIVFADYLKTKEIKSIVLLVLLNIAMIFLSSSTLFLISFVAISFGLLDLYQKRAKSFDYFMILLPNLLYLALFLEKYFLLYIIIGIVVLVHFFSKYVDLIINKYLNYLFVAIPIILYVMAKLIGVPNTWESYHMGYLVLLFNIFISILILFTFKKRRKLEIIPAVFVIYVIAFFNPFSSKLIAAVIGVDVYHRLFFMTKNPIMIIIVLYYLYKFFKDYHASKYLFNLFLLVLLGIYGKVILNATFLDQRYYSNYNYLLREEVANLDLAGQLPKGNYLSIYYQPRMYERTITGNNFRYQGLGPQADNALNRYLTELNFEDEEAYSVIKEYDYLIIFKQKEILSKLPDFEKIYQNSKYILLKKSNR